MSDEERRAFAVPPADGQIEGIDLASLDPADEDHRHWLILAELPGSWEQRREAVPEERHLNRAGRRAAARRHRPGKRP
jgi:hypothetical protein